MNLSIDSDRRHYRLRHVPLRRLLSPAALFPLVAIIRDLVFDVKGECDLIVAGQCGHDEHGEGHVEEDAGPLEDGAEPEGVPEDAHTEEQDDHDAGAQL